MYCEQARELEARYGNYDIVVAGGGIAGVAAALAAAGLSLGEEFNDISEALAGSVFMQNPAASTLVQPGTAVDLYISRGLVIVSDLSGRREADGISIMSRTM